LGRRIIILVSVISLLFLIMIIILNHITKHSDVQPQDMHIITRNIMSRHIENLNRSIIVKSFDSGIYMFELRPMKIYKGLFVMEEDAPFYFELYLEMLSQLFNMKLENVVDPQMMQRHSECSTELAMMFNSTGLYAICRGYMYPYMIICAPPESDKLIEVTIKRFTLRKMNKHLNNTP